MATVRTMKQILDIVEVSMAQHLNVLLTGDHGVGKTQIIRREAHRQGVVVKYFSCATLDPWTDIVGVPIPIDAEAGPEGKRLLFVQPQALRDAELLFLDEFNRSAPKVLNAMMEAIQFHTINGEPLPKLQMVWAAVNPADSGYEVSTLDPAIADRFHVHLQVPAAPSAEFYTKQAGIPKHIAQALVDWWQRDLDDSLRRTISPRRLEYIGTNYVKGISPRYSLPYGIKAPVAHLRHRIDQQDWLPVELTRNSLVNNQRAILAEMDGNADVMSALCQRLGEWPDLVSECVDLFLALTSELQATLLTQKQIKSALVNLAREGRRGRQDLRALADRLLAMGIRIR